MLWCWGSGSFSVPCHRDLRQPHTAEVCQHMPTPTEAAADASVQHLRACEEDGLSSLMVRTPDTGVQCSFCCLGLLLQSMGTNCLDGTPSVIRIIQNLTPPLSAATAACAHTVKWDLLGTRSLGRRPSDCVHSWLHPWCHPHLVCLIRLIEKSKTGRFSKTLRRLDF